MRAREFIRKRTLTEALSFVDIWQIEYWVTTVYAENGIEVHFEPHALLRSDYRSSNISAEQIYSIFYEILEQRAIQRAFATVDTTQGKQQGTQQGLRANILFQINDGSGNLKHGCILFKRKPGGGDSLYISTLAFDRDEPVFLASTPHVYDLGFVKDDFMKKYGRSTTVKNIEVPGSNIIKGPRHFIPDPELLILTATKVYLNAQESAWNDWSRTASAIKNLKNSVDTNSTSSAEVAKLNTTLQKHKDEFLRATGILKRYLDTLNQYSIIDSRLYSSANAELIDRPTADMNTYKRKRMVSISTEWSDKITNQINERLVKGIDEVYEWICKQVGVSVEDAAIESQAAMERKSRLIQDYIKQNSDNQHIQWFSNALRVANKIVQEFNMYNTAVSSSPSNIQAPTVRWDASGSRDEREIQPALMKQYVEERDRNLETLGSYVSRLQQYTAAIQTADSVDNEIKRLIQQLAKYVAALRITNDSEQAARIAGEMFKTFDTLYNLPDDGKPTQIKNAVLNQKYMMLLNIIVTKVYYGFTSGNP